MWPESGQRQTVKLCFTKYLMKHKTVAAMRFTCSPLYSMCIVRNPGKHEFGHRANSEYASTKPGNVDEFLI